VAGSRHPLRRDRVLPPRPSGTALGILELVPHPSHLLSLTSRGGARARGGGGAVGGCGRAGAARVLIRWLEVTILSVVIRVLAPRPSGTALGLLELVVRCTATGNIPRPSEFPPILDDI
jgi:hypothetical protein